MNIKLVTVTWDGNDSFDITKKTLYKSFKYFNPDKDIVHYHFNRGKYWQLEQEYCKKFGNQAEYLLFKIVLLLEKVKKLNADYIIFCDANDVVCLKNVDYLVKSFDLENEVIIGMEKNEWPTKQTKSEWPNFKDYSEEDVANRTYLNSGMILAKKEKYVELLESMVNNILKNDNINFFNDQGVFVWHYTNDHSPKIRLDRDCIFTVNTFSRAIDEYQRIEDTKFVSKSTGTEPCFVHDNGWNHGSPKYVLSHELRRLYIPSYRHLKNIAAHKPINFTHKEYLFKLKNEFGFQPKVIWDVGACVLYWTTIAKEVWPNAEYVLFEAMEESEDLFDETMHKYQIGVFSDIDDKEITFYKNVTFPGGNSYYKENKAHSSMASVLFDGPSNQFKRKTVTLDSVLKKNKFAGPDLLKIDVQGCEIDILRGAQETLKSVKHLIVELQHIEYNIGAQLCDESIPLIESMGFELVTPKFSISSHADADYHFIKKSAVQLSNSTKKLNILTTGILGDDPLISYASEQLSKAEFEKYFETRWILVTHSQEKANACKAQANKFKNISVIVDEKSRKNRTESTRQALMGINEGEYVWIMPEGFIPSPDCASKVSDLFKNNSSIGIEGTKCMGIDHVLFKMPNHSKIADETSMILFINDVRKNGTPIISEKLSIGSVASSGKIEHSAKSDMERLSVIYWNLKYTFHKYTNVYEPILNRKRYSTQSLLEIGVAQGASLRTFRDFFPNAKIFGLDINPESVLSEPRIEVVIGNSSEVDPFLKIKELNGNNNFDIIVDDGSHKQSDQIRSFEILWPMLNENGLYLIEDVHDENSLKNELLKIVGKNFITTFDLRPQSNLVDSGIVLISK